MAIAKKKKKFHDVEIPILNKKTQLYSFTPEELEGRRIVYDLTRMLRGKNALLDLNVKIENEIPTSYPVEFRILPTFIRRVIRKRTDYVEDSFKTKCKDAEIIIKPLLVTRRRVSRRVRKALREKAREEIINYVKDKNSEKIFEDILKNQLQKPLSLTLKKIYPLSLCEIRIIKVLKKIEEEQEKDSNKTEKKSSKKPLEEKNSSE